MDEWVTSDLDVKSCPVSVIGDILTLPSSWCKWEEGEETEAGGGDGSISTKKYECDLNSGHLNNGHNLNIKL